MTVTIQKPFVRPPIVQAVDYEAAPVGEVHRQRVVMTENATGNETLVPVMILRSGEPGPTVGITAALHGNELNGIVVIHKLLARLAKAGLKKGTVVAVPVVNIPGYLRQQREFEDGKDLNRIMPGRADGNESALYAHRFLERVIRGLDYLFDLHTASTGRVNSLYIRADMTDERTAALARVMTPQIILHSPDVDGTLRGAAQSLGICSLTVEIGDPQRHQKTYVRSTRLGLQEALESLGLLDDISDPDPGDIVECARSYWIHSDRGGVLTVLVDVAQHLKKGEPIAVLHNIWGDLVREYVAPEDGIVIGHSVNPTARAGSRIVHLGIVS